MRAYTTQLFGMLMIRNKVTQRSSWPLHLAASRRQAEREAICAADDGSMPPLHLLQRSERSTKIAAYPGGALHATERLGPGADFRQMKVALVFGDPQAHALGASSRWVCLPRNE